MTYRYIASMYYIVSLLGLPTVQFWSLPACGLWEGPALYNNNSFAKYLLFWYHHHLLLFFQLSKLMKFSVNFRVRTFTSAFMYTKSLRKQWMATLIARPRASKMLEAGLHYKIVLPHAPSCLSHLLSLDLWSWKTLRNVSVKMGIACLPAGQSVALPDWNQTLIHRIF